MSNVLTFLGSGRGPFARSSWCFQDGEQWVVMGPNGSGKTLLANLLAGETPTRGIELEMPEYLEGHVAMMTFGQQQEQADGSWLQARWHDSLSDDSQTVAKFLSFETVNDINPFEVRDDDAAERKAFAAASKRADTLFRVKGLFDRRMVQLSNGEMRRVLLARALLKSPALLVLDDPFAGLDPAMRDRLKEDFDTLAKEGMHLVLMLRNKDEIPRCATHLMTLKNLRIVQKRKIAPADFAESGEGGFNVSAASAGKDARPAVIDLRRVTVRYGRRTVLNKLDWTVREGERWLVVGPNGCGKTTLMSLINGDNPAAYGEDIRVFGQARASGENLWEVRRKIGQVSPELQCYSNGSLTCLQTVFTGCYNAEGEIMRSTAARRKEALALLSRLGLKEKAKTPFESLSAGTQRLVLLARALLPHPRLLILDEPCMNLDVRARQLVLGVIEKVVRKDSSLTVLCVAHRKEDAPKGMDHLLDLGKPQ